MSSRVASSQLPILQPQSTIPEPLFNEATCKQHRIDLFPPPGKERAAVDKGIKTLHVGDHGFRPFEHQAVNLSSPVESRHPAAGKDLKILHLEGVSVRKSTFTQATVNCVSLLFGLGILSSPYAVAQAGWMGVIISIFISSCYAYTAYLMSKCVMSNPDNSTYQDVAKSTFGRKAQKFINTLFYIEILGTLVGYCISVGDNLAYMFPNFSFGLPGLSNRNFMIFVACLIVLPSVWLRDLSALSFTSMWCIVSTVILLVAILLVGTMNHVGFTHPIPLMHIKGVPVAAGLYAFSYGGTSVFPSICKSMKHPEMFPQVLVISFAIAVASVSGLGVIGAYMFGDHTRSQITLSMPSRFISTKVVLWMTVTTPMFKFALQLSPITTALEAHLCRRLKHWDTRWLGISSMMMRSLVLALIAIVAMVFPYFEYMVALVGSSMTIAICLIFPCIFYLKLHRATSIRIAITTISLLIIIGVMLAIYGTVAAIEGLLLIRRNNQHS